MKTFEGDLVLEKDTVFGESITVKGCIVCKDNEPFSLRVVGNIDARDIICEKRIKKLENCITKARIFIQEKSKLQRKEW